LHSTYGVPAADFSPCYTWFFSALTLRQAEPRLRRCALPANRSPERSITIPTLTMWQAKLRYDKRLGCGEEPRVEHAMMRRCGGLSCFGLVSAECTTTRRRSACTSKFLVGPRASTREPTTSVLDRTSTATLVLCLFVACVLEATAFAESWQPLASHCDESCHHCPRHRQKGQNCFNRIWGWQTVSDTGAVVSCEEQNARVSVRVPIPWDLDIDSTTNRTTRKEVGHMTSIPLSTTDGSMACNRRLGPASPRPGMTSEAPWVRQYSGFSITM
jgi:hypothetical protein